MRRGRKEGMVVWCLLALLYVTWPDFDRGLLQVFLGDLFGSWSSADGLGNVRSAMSAHARVCWQQGRIRYAQPWSSPLLAPWPSLITPCSRNNNVSGAPADPYTCRHTNHAHSQLPPPDPNMHVPHPNHRHFPNRCLCCTLEDLHAGPPTPSPPPSSCWSQSWWAVIHAGGQTELQSEEVGEVGFSASWETLRI